MSKISVPKGYRSKLNLYETQTAIGFTNRTFEGYLSEALNLKRVSAPLFVDPESGLNDDLNGVERPVKFELTDSETGADRSFPRKMEAYGALQVQFPYRRRAVYDHERDQKR